MTFIALSWGILIGFCLGRWHGITVSRYWQLKKLEAKRAARNQA